MATWQSSMTACRSARVRRRRAKSKYKRHIQVVIGALGLLGCIAYTATTWGSGDIPGGPATGARHLLSSETSSEDELANYPTDLLTKTERQHGGIILHIIGCTYMFAGLAIVCDEFFVPALEGIIEHFEIDDDVAGATFMAAGGSAPELATSLLGTFVSKSNVGFGTIVGSAVFNILFVIGMCAIFSKGEMELTWWPLFRDASIYLIDLIILLLCFYDGEIQIWEAFLLFSLYFLYVLFMKYNSAIEEKIKGIAFIQKAMGGDHTSEKAAAKSNDVEMGKTEDKKEPKEPVSPPGIGSEKPEQQNNSPKDAPPRDSTRPGLSTQFHTGFFKNIINDNSDEEKDRREEGTNLLKATPGPLARARWLRAGRKVMQNNKFASLKKTLQIASNPKENGKDEKPATQMADVVLFTMIKKEKEKEPKPVNNAVDGGNKEEKKEKVVEPAPAAKEEPEIDGEGEEPMDLDWPSTPWKQITYVLLAPITYTLYYTTPDVRREGSEDKWIRAFITSICWIGAYSYLLVWWATLIGDTVGIPTEIMGLTFLAIGTSIPDLFSSIIVAKQGKGDMAVSSSIGSNIFDITVGLPFPWCIYTLVHLEALEVGNDGLFINVVLLILMLFSCVIVIYLRNWKMNKELGVIFFVLWVVFVAISLMVEYEVVKF